VRFRASDVFLAGQQDTFSAPTEEAEMEGAIVDFSDSGKKLRVFAVVELDNGQMAVVPVEKVKLVTPASPEDEPGGQLSDRRR
jgi:hypothetical protein